MPLAPRRRWHEYESCDSEPLSDRERSNFGLSFAPGWLVRLGKTGGMEAKEVSQWLV
jgi:hypothetical protein